MARILHLSDLHLSERTERQVVGDIKEKALLPISERESRLDLLRNSLVGLKSTLGPDPLDAVVVTGDVALAYSADGFAALSETLSFLGGLLPPEAKRIVVVPGNHDVDQGTPASSRERYRMFVDAVRAKGYTTPLLEGVDISDADPPGTVPPHSPLLVDEDENFAILAVNSTNYCWSKRDWPGGDPQFTELRAQARSIGGADLEEALNALAMEDIARISPPQLRHLGRCLNELASPKTGGPLRIVALHHHLLPISANEEFKPFENITNLGQFRATLADASVSIVLHGHKHVAATYVDDVVLGNMDVSGARGRYLVSSANSVWRHDEPQEFARLITVTRNGVRTWNVRVIPLHCATAGGGGTLRQPVACWSPDFTAGNEPPTLSGANAEDVYGQILNHFQDHPESTLRGLRCFIEDGSSALSLPPQLSQLDGVTDPAEWSKELVDWWQAPEPDLEGGARAFNHGQRIRRKRNGASQVDQVVAALSRKPGTTRGVIQLLDQERDDVGNPDQRIPSFFSLHFVQETMANLLHCIAYFRKQEMLLWWPINIAEIAMLQQEVIEGLAATTNGRTFQAGSITTIAGQAVRGYGRPRVLVPRIDRLAQSTPSSLWGLAYDLAISRSVAAREDLERLFRDWHPTGHVEPDGTALSLTGLRVLREALELFGGRTEDEAAQDLARHLDDLYMANKEYAEREENSGNAVSSRINEYKHWAGRVADILEQIHGDLDRLIAGAADAN